MIRDIYDLEVDNIGNKMGPFSELRRQLWEIGVMVLPDPILGFRATEDEKKSLDIIDRFNQRYNHTLDRIAS